MGLELLTERYKDQIAGVLSCYDRIIIQGTLPKWCYASGMTSYFYERQMKIFDYPKWAQPLRDAIRENAERLAAENGIEIEFVRSKKSFRKEDRVKEILDKRGGDTGLVCILSALEPCGSYQPWYDKKNKRAYLKRDDGKCLHYYFYFIDEDLGLCSARLPTSRRAVHRVARHHRQQVLRLAGTLRQGERAQRLGSPRFLAGGLGEAGHHRLPSEEPAGRLRGG